MEFTIDLFFWGNMDFRRCEMLTTNRMFPFKHLNQFTEIWFFFLIGRESGASEVDERTLEKSIRLCENYLETAR